MWLANNFHLWLRHSWKSLPHHLSRDPKTVIHVNPSIILYSMNGFHGWDVRTCEFKYGNRLVQRSACVWTCAAYTQYAQCLCVFCFMGVISHCLCGFKWSICSTLSGLPNWHWIVTVPKTKSKNVLTTRIFLVSYCIMIQVCVYGTIIPLNPTWCEAIPYPDKLHS